MIAAAMPAESSSRSDATVTVRRLLVAMILGCFAMQAVLVFRQAINWDEFRFLSDIHVLARGELSSPVQTFHAHFFRWLLWLPGNEIDQIIAARAVMLALEAGTAAMVYRCASRFAGAEASLFAALTWLTFAYTVQHGASFRFDPPSTFLLMAAAAVLTTARLRFAATALVGVLVAAAALITIKSVFYVPTLLVLAAWRIAAAEDRRSAVTVFIAGGIAGAVALALLYLGHQSLLAPGLVTAAQDQVAGSMAKTIGESPILPQLKWLLQALVRSPINYAIVAGGIVLALHGAIAGPHRLRAFALLAFAFPLLTLLFYRNAFPYYYAFILAPAAVLAAPAAERIARWLRLDFLGAILLAIAAVHAYVAITPIIMAQRATIDAIHRMFPHPVAYLDRCSMVASSRKYGPFLSSWGIENYRDAGRPIMRRLLIERRPVYLIANAPILEDALAGISADEGLLAEDAAALRGNFVPHWGPIWVAGKQIAPVPAGAPFEMLIAGRYSIEADGPVMIDGIEYRPGGAVTLNAGRHVIAGAAGSAVTLRIGEGLHRPDAPPPGRLFDKF